VIPPLVNIYLTPPPEVCDIPDQAAHYHILRPQFGGFISEASIEKQISMVLTSDFDTRVLLALGDWIFHWGFGILFLGLTGRPSSHRQLLYVPPKCPILPTVLSKFFSPYMIQEQTRHN
jgi:hypothetical protein